MTLTQVVITAVAILTKGPRAKGVSRQAIKKSVGGEHTPAQVCQYIRYLIDSSR